MATNFRWFQKTITRGLSWKLRAPFFLSIPNDLQIIKKGRVGIHKPRCASENVGLAYGENLRSGTLGLSSVKGEGFKNVQKYANMVYGWPREKMRGERWNQNEKRHFMHALSVIYNVKTRRNCVRDCDFYWDTKQFELLAKPSFIFGSTLCFFKQVWNLIISDTMAEAF